MYKEGKGFKERSEQRISGFYEGGPKREAEVKSVKSRERLLDW